MFLPYGWGYKIYKSFSEIVSAICMLFHFKRAVKITNKKSKELTQKAKQVASLDERHETMPYFSQMLSTNEKTAVMALCKGSSVQRS